MNSRPARFALAALLLPACSGDINDGSADPAVTRRVSVSAAGAEANRACENPDVSADGRYVVFESAAANLVPGDLNAKIDIFRKDLATGEIILVSVSSAGEQGDGDSTAPSISDDGTRVAFQSSASNLAPTDGNPELDVFVRKIPESETLHVSQAAHGGPPTTEAGELLSSSEPSLSPDGEFVAFTSTGIDLDPDVTTFGFGQVYLHDIGSAVTKLISVSPFGDPAFGSSARPSVSLDGAFVAFHSESTDLVLDDGNFFNDVFVRDVAGGATERVSQAIGGGDPDGDSVNARITPDGHRVVFQSGASNLVDGDLNVRVDVFLADRQTGACLLVSGAPGGALAANVSTEPDISNDGRFVAFLSLASNLVEGDTNGWDDVFWHDLKRAATYRVSVRTGGGQASLGSAGRPALTGRGRQVVFASGGPDLTVGDTNGVADVFIRGPLY